MIEQRDRYDDQFVFVPDQQRIRRVGSGQRADPFMGSDFTIEDLERRYVEDYGLEGHRLSEVDGEKVVVVRVQPLYESAYDVAELFISTRDFAILEARYFRGPGEQPVKVLRAPREFTRSFDGHMLPTRMTMQDRVRGTATEARFERIVVNPNLDDALFTAAAVESGRKIPSRRSAGVGGQGR